MPGFNIAPYGGGYSAAGPSNIIETRRKHRWVFETLGRGTGTFSQAELLLLKSASRPKFKFDPAKMHHNQEMASFAGKQEWEAINMKWYDGEQNPDVSRGIYAWIETVVNMFSISVAAPSLYKRTGTLLMIDGAGQTDEHWTLLGTWPVSCDWESIDYSSSEIMDISVSMSIDRAVRDCVNPPVPIPIAPNCPPS